MPDYKSERLEATLAESEGALHLPSLGVAEVLDLVANPASNALHDVTVSSPESGALGALSGLPRLEEIVLEEGKDVEFSFTAAPNLRYVEVRNSTGYEDLSSLSPSTRMQEIVLTNFQNVRSLDGIQQAAYLRSVECSLCPELEDISALKGLALESCIVSGCPKLSDISAPSELNDLNSVNISNCPGVSKEQVGDLQRSIPDCTIISDWI